jgi:hypothetical protein
MKPVTIKLPEGNIKKCFGDWVQRFFFLARSESTGNKSKNRKLGLHQTKKQRKHQYSESTTYRMGENIFKLYVWYGWYPEYKKNPNMTEKIYFKNWHY